MDTLRARLIEAADVELAEYGSLTGRFEAVAHRAGVSRATAYRQLGSVSELLKQVGLRRAQKYVAGLRDVMAAEQTVLAKLEAAMVYGARVLPADPIVLDLISRQFSRAADPEVYAMVDDLTVPTMAEGQRSGEIRSDIDLEFVVRHLFEQSYLATRGADKSADAVRRRFAMFVEPAIVPKGGGKCARCAAPVEVAASGASGSAVEPTRESFGHDDDMPTAAPSEQSLVHTNPLGGVRSTD